MGEEKRSYIRWKTKIRVAYTLAGTDEFYKEVFTEDISESGLQILVADKLRLKQTVKLKLEFVYDSVPITVMARVAYLKEYENQRRVGLEFINMDPFQTDRLKRGLERVRQEFKDEAKERDTRQ
jgi:c-di-GMP-binding flagellar brake protein YcgR